MSTFDKSFAFLHDSLPQWLHDVTRVEEKAVAMHNDLARISVPAQNPSIDSIRCDAASPPPLDASPSSSHPLPSDPLASRKRKTPSALSDSTSGPLRYRARTMVVVPYDGDMQKSFESLVRAIGTGRNMLRRAKMEAKMHQLAALSHSSDDDDDDDIDHDGDGEMGSAVLSKIKHRPRMTSLRSPNTARSNAPLGAGERSPDRADLFDSTDKILEQAQEQCEKAAHLALRDGDCRKELRGIRQNFQLVLDTAKSQVTRSAVDQSDDPPELQPQHASDTSSSSFEPAYKSHVSTRKSPHRASPLPHQVKSSATAVEPKVVDIDVDDDDADEDDEFVMPPLRLTSRMGIRA